MMSPHERAELVAEIVSAVHVRASDVSLTDDEQRWVRMAIHKQAQSIELRRSIIDKTLTGLVWATIVGFGAIIMSFMRDHGWK